VWCQCFPGVSLERRWTCPAIAVEGGGGPPRGVVLLARFPHEPLLRAMGQDVAQTRMGGLLVRDDDGAIAPFSCALCAWQARATGERVFRNASCPRLRTEDLIEGGEPESVSLGQRHEVGIRDIRMAGHRWDTIDAKIISDESAALARRQVAERSQCIVRRSPVTWAQTDAQEPKFGQRTGYKTGLPIEPGACLGMLCMRSPHTGQQEVHIEQVSHGNSLSKAFTVCAVMGGAPAGASSKRRPRRPLTMRARVAL